MAIDLRLIAGETGFFLFDRINRIDGIYRPEIK
jgi:hypothetical protein